MASVVSAHLAALYIHPVLHCTQMLALGGLPAISSWCFEAAAAATAKPATPAGSLMALAALLPTWAAAAAAAAKIMTAPTATTCPLMVVTPTEAVRNNKSGWQSDF